MGKKVAPVLDALLSPASKIFALGAKGVEFFSKNLWLLAVAINAYMLIQAMLMSLRIVKPVLDSPPKPDDPASPLSPLSLLGPCCTGSHFSPFSPCCLVSPLSPFGPVSPLAPLDPSCPVSPLSPFGPVSPS